MDIDNINTVEKRYDDETNTFISYKVTFNGTNVMYSIPVDTDNTDYQAIQQWIADGGSVIDNPPE